MLKRALPIYDDFSSLHDLEDGEILEESDGENDDATEELVSRAVLPVGVFDAVFSEHDVPQTGEQYLCLVRHQRKGLPGIVHTSAENASVSDAMSVAVSPKAVLLQSLLPSHFLTNGTSRYPLSRAWATQYWQSHQIHRQQLHDSLLAVAGDGRVGLPGPRDRAAWLHRLYLAVAKESDEQDVLQPAFATLAALVEDQELVLRLLSHHVVWIEGELREHLLDRRHWERFVTWMHALLMCLDLQLTSPEIAVLRQLVVALHTLPPSAEKDELAAVIVVGYGQYDLICE